MPDLHCVCGNCARVVWLIKADTIGFKGSIVCPYCWTDTLLDVVNRSKLNKD